MIDVLYRLRADPRNEPLRYSLRSLANIDHGEVFVVGYCPPWLVNVTVLEGGRARQTYDLTYQHLLSAAKALPGRRLLLVDDDMFILRPVQTMPVLNAGSLRGHAKTKMGAYGRSMERTAAWLEAQGVTEPASYELHVPLVVDTDIAAGLLPDLAGVQVRSMYGNLAALGGDRIDDVKLRTAAPLPPGDFVSTSPATFRRRRADIAALFPQPSRYEA